MPNYFLIKKKIDTRLAHLMLIRRCDRQRYAFVKKNGYVFLKICKLYFSVCGVFQCLRRALCANEWYIIDIVHEQNVATAKLETSTLRSL